MVHTVLPLLRPPRPNCSLPRLHSSRSLLPMPPTETAEPFG
uniref:Uncharacterized protein n=1 Tax=Arundo donax TaxID=35708 RepID=A0A0A9FQW4_ARUDO